MKVEATSKSPKKLNKIILDPKLCRSSYLIKNKLKDYVFEEEKNSKNISEISKSTLKNRKKLTNATIKTVGVI
jgi:hypothetical protein